MADQKPVQDIVPGETIIAGSGLVLGVRYISVVLHLDNGVDEVRQWGEAVEVAIPEVEQEGEG